jgi:HK97 family phage major capsid protein
MTTEELRKQLAELKARRQTLAEGLEELAHRSGDLSTGAAKRWDEMMKSWEAMGPEIARVEAEIADKQERAAALKGAGVYAATGDGARGAAEHGLQHLRHASTEDQFSRAAQAGYDETIEGRNALRDAALAAIDVSWSERSDVPADHRASAELLVRAKENMKSTAAINRYVAAYSDPGYVTAWSRYMRGGNTNLRSDDLDAIERANSRSAFDRAALNEGNNAQGGFIVPPFLDPAIILTNTGINNPFRAISTVKTISTQVWKGVTSAGVTAEWTAEASEMTDASPSLTQPSVTPIRADAYVQASFEMLEDTDIATELAMLFADARDILEGTAFAVGTGSTQPYGIVTELQLVTASRTAANTNGSLGAVDVFNLSTNLGARFQANASFVCHRGIQNLLRALATGPSQAQSAFWADFGQGLPSKLTGYPIYLASGMQGSLSTATASNDDVLVLGDFRAGYYIVDRIGMSVAYNPLVIGSNRRPTGEVGWAAFWRTGARAVVPGAFQLLRV